MEKVQVLTLSEGDRFFIGKDEYIVIGWINKFMPTIGKTEVMKTKKIDDQTTQLFYRGIMVLRKEEY